MIIDDFIVQGGGAAVDDGIVKELLDISDIISKVFCLAEKILEEKRRQHGLVPGGWIDGGCRCRLLAVAVQPRKKTSR